MKLLCVFWAESVCSGRSRFGCVSWTLLTINVPFIEINAEGKCWGSETWAGGSVTKHVCSVWRDGDGVCFSPVHVCELWAVGLAWVMWPSLSRLVRCRFSLRPFARDWCGSRRASRRRVTLHLPLLSKHR